MRISEIFNTTEMIGRDIRVTTELVEFGDSERVRLLINEIPVLMIYPSDVNKLIGMLKTLLKRAKA